MREGLLVRPGSCLLRLFLNLDVGRLDNWRIGSLEEVRGWEGVLARATAAGGIPGNCIWPRGN